jgi:hypothetical protein
MDMIAEMRLAVIASLVVVLAVWSAAKLLQADRQLPPQAPELGLNGSLHAAPVFPASDPWNTDISKQPVDPNSAKLLQSIGMGKSLHPDFGSNWRGKPFGIPYVVVAAQQGRVPVRFEYADESDPGPYPIPPDAPVEGGRDADGDRHVLVIDRDALKLFELWRAFPTGDGGWKAGSGAVFDLRKSPARPKGWTSADAAGLPVFAGLVRYDEVVEQGNIPHALRFTVARTRRAYVPPATHWASKNTDPALPPMGMRVRLRADYDTSRFPKHAQVILSALKRYGMIVADNGGDWFLSGTADARWDDDQLSSLKRVKGSDFEVVQMEGVVSDQQRR